MMGRLRRSWLGQVPGAPHDVDSRLLLDRIFDGEIAGLYTGRALSLSHSLHLMAGG